MPELTREDVVAVLGPVDEVLIAEVVATGATREELVEAKCWTASDEALVNAHRPLASGRVATLLEILDPDDGEDGLDPRAGAASLDPG